MHSSPPTNSVAVRSSRGRSMSSRTTDRSSPSELHQRVAAVRCGAVTAANGSTFPALGRKQPDTVVLERSDPVGMAQDRCQTSRIRSKAFLRAAPIVKNPHSLPRRLESPLLPNYSRVAARGKCRITAAICESVGIGRVRRGRQGTIKWLRTCTFKIIQKTTCKRRRGPIFVRRAPAAVCSVENTFNSGVEENSPKWQTEI
jgi:hypothetical protein